MLWPAGEDRVLKSPERGLLDSIAAGELDEHLVAIADAVWARRELPHTIDSATANGQAGKAGRPLPQRSSAALHWRCAGSITLLPGSD